MESLRLLLSFPLSAWPPPVTAGGLPPPGSAGAFFVYGLLALFVSFIWTGSRGGSDR